MLVRAYARKRATPAPSEGGFKENLVLPNFQTLCTKFFYLASTNHILCLEINLNNLKNINLVLENSEI